MSQDSKHFESQVIHEGYTPKDMGDSLNPPLFQSSTFAFASAEQGERRFKGEEKGYRYSRLGNPTVEIFERRMASLENGDMALAFGSGMAAISAAIMSQTKAGDVILCPTGLYGGTYDLLVWLEEKYNIKTLASGMSTKEEIRKQMTDDLACIYVETPINPTMKLIDLEMIAEIGKEYDIPVIVDNTFSTPYLQRPLDLGCDIALHSATKYIGGHGDVVGGVVVGRKKYMKKVVDDTRKKVGAIMSPFDAWLLLRGLKTLPVRMDRHCYNAEKIFAKLKAHPKIEKVNYPKNAESEYDDIFNKQMKKGGGVISFSIKGGKKEAQKLLNALKFVTLAVSLGDTETLIQHPASMTHASIPVERREKMGITDKVLRMSVGLEAWEDIWADLEEALSRI